MLSFEQVSVNERLYDISCELQAGKFVHLLGNNGAGKSTLLAVASRLLRYDRGVIRFSEQRLEDYDHAQLAAMRCFQEQHQASHFTLTVKEALSFFSAHTGLPESLESALEINQFMSRNLNELSGGEMRRVHIARVLLQIWHTIERGGGLILLDEPIQGLDYRHQHLLFRLLNELANNGNLILASHHELNLCHRYADQVLLLQEGRILANGIAESVMTTDNLSRTFQCKITTLMDQFGNRLFQTYLE